MTNATKLHYSGLMNTTPQSITAVIKQYGLRITPIRLALIHYFCDHHSPAEVSEIINYLQSSNISPHKTTLYRDIELLLKLELLHKVDLGDGVMRYELAHRDHHHHLVCTGCKAIADVAIPGDVHEMTRHIEKEFAFKINAHSLEFFGLCQNCQIT